MFRDGSPLVTSEARTRRHYSRVGHMSFDECRFQLNTLVRRRLVALEMRRATFINELTAHAAGGQRPRIFHEG